LKHNLHQQLLALALAASVHTALAAPGDLDPTFDGDGKVTTRVSTNDFGFDDAKAVFVQPDGRIIAVGASDGRIALARYLTNGSLDPDFGTGGIVTTMLTQDDYFDVNGAALQPDGKIVVVGQVNIATPASVDLFAARYQTNGALDPSFGTGGIAQHNLGFDDSANAVKVQSDGRLVVAASGYDFNLNQSLFGALRLLTNGALDTTFSGDGLAEAVFAGSDLAQPTALVLQPDGNIVVAGSASFGSSNRVALARFQTNGTLDATFGSGGVVTTSLGATNASAADVALQSDGRVVVAYEFGYDGANRLVSITDRDTNVTRIEWNAQGQPAAIVGPYGQRTVLETDTNGWLARIENPAGEAVQLTHDELGLLKQVTWPGGQVSRYTYDLHGRLASATDPTGAIKHLDRTGSNNDYTVTLTTHLGRTTTYWVRHLPNGDTQRVTSDCGGGTSQVLMGTDGRVTAADGVGITRSLVLGPDPRWGMRAPITASLTTVTPGRLTNRVTMQRTVTLEGPGDPLLVRSQTDVLTMNGRSWTNTYTRSNSTVLITSPAGRRVSLQFDAQGRPVQSQQGDDDPVAFSFDPRGRLAALAQGQGAARWTNTFAYHADGFLAAHTDALGRQAVFTNDAVGRVTAQGRPDGAVLTLSYDANGNVRGLTPPGDSEHAFAYTLRDELASYTPPIVGAQSNVTSFTYDADRKATRIDFPEGGVAQFTYEGTSCQLSLADLGDRQRTYGYDVSGRVLSLGSSDGVVLQHAYDGQLLTNVTWSGAVSGSVSQTFDHDLRVTSLRVSGAPPVNVLYDPDGLPVQVGEVVLARRALNRTIVGTMQGPFSDTNRHDGFGAIVGYTAFHGANVVYAADYTRDLLGRISRKTETVGATTRVFDYTYDLAGRLVEVAHDGVLAASFTYDANGNRLTRTDAGGTVMATTDAQDRLLQQGTTTYQHNANGERIARQDGGQTTTYQYERMGSLIGVTLPDGRQIEYVLDAQDRRTVTDLIGVTKFAGLGS
jgi:uncharacterized delta-60 repeat protein